ncbi:hypothetical protein NQ318_006422 [Aromia moschata]|uniref:Homeobox domain-containing protein n=1 Tax=Aromia moschata TaxID=1265417 RepID=A0AAV8XTI0_9CUCU|nr:hypothetical protein NQ318_006422 [Aromia moschata]
MLRNVDYMETGASTSSPVIYHDSSLGLGSHYVRGFLPVAPTVPLSNALSLVSDGQNHLNLFNTRQQPKKKRKSRTAFTNHQIFELEKRFLYQKYLSPADRDEIASSLGLTNAQVITWFQNRRAKLKRDMEELKKDVESAKILSAHKSFLENVTDLGILKKKPVISEDECPKNLVVSEK